MSSVMQEMLKAALSDNVMGRLHAFEWFSQLQFGGTTVEDCHCSDLSLHRLYKQNLQKFVKLSMKTDEVVLRMALAH